MRIGIDISTWDNGRGFGRFTRELTIELVQSAKNHEWILFADQAPAFCFGDNVKLVVVNQSTKVINAAVEGSSRQVTDMLAFTRALKRENLDVMFYPAVYSWFPSPPGLPVVLTIHDAIAEHFPELVFPSWKNRFLWTLKTKLANFQATRILTVSQSARNEIVDHLRIASDRIDLTTEGPNHVFAPISDPERVQSIKRRVRNEFDLPGSATYCVYVGGFAPHKNLLRLLDAFERTQDFESTQTVCLLLIGDVGGHGFHSNHENLLERISESPFLTKRVRFTGFISDEFLADIYATSLATLFPSLSEGFGLPAVESMASGTPVLASNKGSLPEVVGNAGLLFDPTNTDSIARTLNDFLSNDLLQKTLQGRTQAQSDRFTWQIAAEKALESLQKAQGRQ